jgi:hypothetical protein
MFPLRPIKGADILTHILQSRLQRCSNFGQGLFFGGW